MVEHFYAWPHKKTQLKPDSHFPATRRRDNNIIEHQLRLQETMWSS